MRKSWIACNYSHFYMCLPLFFLYARAVAFLSNSCCLFYLSLSAGSRFKLGDNEESHCSCVHHIVLAGCSSKHFLFCAFWLGDGLGSSWLQTFTGRLKYLRWLNFNQGPFIWVELSPAAK